MYKQEQPPLQRVVCDDEDGNEVPAVIIQASSGPEGPSPVMKKMAERGEPLPRMQKYYPSAGKKIDARGEERERNEHIPSNLPRLLISMKSMYAIVDKIECIECRQEPQEQDLLTDNRGLTYIAVRDCDLERFSVK
jgi:hypothetical protein